MTSAPALIDLLDLSLQFLVRPLSGLSLRQGAQGDLGETRLHHTLEGNFSKNV
jgi:hypothetical protein